MAWPIPTPNPGEVNSIAISRDGKKVIAGTFYFSKANTNPPRALGTYACDEYGNELWTRIFAPVTQNDGTGQTGIYWVALSRDGKWAASCGGNDSGPLGPEAMDLHKPNPADQPAFFFHLGDVIYNHQYHFPESKRNM